MARRGGRVEEYDYEERAYYERDTAAPARARPAQVRARDLLEIDVNTRRERSRNRGPDILREDYGRTEGQDLVLRKREVETFRPVRRSPPRARSPSIERERVRTRVVERERERSPSPDLERVRTTTRTVERERERERSPEPERIRTRIVERERDRSYSPAGERTRTRVVEKDREKDRIRGPRESSIERTRTTTRTVERERERSPSPIRERIRTRVVERERARSPSSESESDLVDPEPPIIRAPPIHQEIITHHRHIDHGYEYKPAPTPPPPLRQPRPRDPPRETTETDIEIYRGRGETDIDIHTSSKRGGREEAPRERRPREFYEDDILVERDRDRLHVRETHNSGRRSASARRSTIDSRESEEEYYARKTAERARIGEAYNGATRDWEIVDVPPGTERVRMDGIGGGSQEVTWQRYNGVRRSKFVPERDTVAVYDRERDYDREEVTDRRITLSMPSRNKYGDMWTEITKDLVVGEAIEELGYDYEETEYFFYVMQYLKYEDVQELVFLSDDIRRSRRDRIRDMAYERERKKEVKEIEYRRERDRPEFEDERIIEREIIYDSGPRRPRGYR